MNDKCCEDFQAAVDEYLIRHRSILDVLTKYQEAAARVNRAIAKTVTECGCVEIKAGHRSTPPQIKYSDLKDFMPSHFSGEPCEQCKEIISAELGHSMFYLAALCNVTGLNFHTIMQQEYRDVTTLGAFHLS